MKSNFYFSQAVVIFTICGTLVTCGSTNQSQSNIVNPGILELSQGRWVLTQNRQQELLIKKDTICYFYSGRLEGKYIIRISSTVISKTFKNDTIKGKDRQYFIEELNVISKEVESQYSIISYDKKKFVISPLHKGELLTYIRRKQH